jgi:hypothetical protein
MTPEAKAAEELSMNVHWVGMHHNPRKEMQRIILKANSEHYLPLLNEVSDFCRFHGIGCDHVVSEIARLEAAKGDA